VLARDELRAFLARMLGRSNDVAVELALRSVELAVAGDTALVLLGPGDVVPIARTIHWRVRERLQPFIVADPRRGDMPTSVRSPSSCRTVAAAFERARRGTLCLRLERLPMDFGQVSAQLRTARDVMLIFCAHSRAEADPLFTRPAPVIVPPLARRSVELDRIIAEYAGDALFELGAPTSSFTAADHAWVREHAAASLTEIEVATLRLITLRTSRNLSDAAARLGMSPVSLSRWLGRRKLPPASGDSSPAPTWFPIVELRRAPPTLAEIWQDRVLQRLEEGQEGEEHPFAFGEANIRIAAEEWLEQIKSGRAPWDGEAIAGLTALLAVLELRLGPRSDKPAGGRRR
jgi:hypothetical protein